MANDENSQPTWALIVLSVSRYLPWPILLVLAFLIFLEPIKQVAVILPEKLMASDSVKVGSLVFEVGKEARSRGNPELAVALSGLTRESVTRLIQLEGLTQIPSFHSETDSPFRISVPDAVSIDAFTLLEDKGFITLAVEPERYLGLLLALDFEKQSLDDEASTWAEWVGGTRQEWVTFKTEKLLSEDDIDDLSNFDVDFTEEGLRAKTLILDVVADLLSSNPPS